MRKTVNVCGMMYEMSIADNGVLFSDKSGTARRVMFTVKSNLWCLLSFHGMFDSIPLCHLVRMQELLASHIGADHSVLELKFNSSE